MNIKDFNADVEMEWDSFNKHLADYDGESEEVVCLNWNSFKDVAYDFYELGKQSKEPVSHDLEEAAARYERENREIILSSVNIVDAFIAGAEWQREQMELDGIVTLTESDFDAEKEKASEWGYNLCKKQMMKGAVEGEIGYWNQRGLSIRLDQSLEKLGYDEDTEVKIIIVKQ